MANVDKHRGFGGIELLLVLFVVLVLAGAGWYTWERVSKKTATNSNGSNSNQPSPAHHSTTPQPKPDPYAGWKTYTNTDYQFSFQYPSDWTLKSNLSDIGRSGPEGSLYVVSPSGTEVHFDPNLVVKVETAGMTKPMQGRQEPA